MRVPGSICRYKIKTGDTLWFISYNAGVTVDELIAANRGVDPNFLQVAQGINVPFKGKCPPGAGEHHARYTCASHLHRSPAYVRRKRERSGR